MWNWAHSGCWLSPQRNWFLRKVLGRQPPECSDGPRLLTVAFTEPKAYFLFANWIVPETWLGRGNGECAQFNLCLPTKINVHVNICPFWMIPQYVNTSPKLYIKMCKLHKHCYQFMLGGRAGGRGENEEGLRCVRTWFYRLVASVNNNCKNSA